MNISYCELREKEVINIFDGKKLGRVLYLNFDDKGQIRTFSVPGEKSFFKNFSQEPQVIPWCKIIKIGIDTILVDLC